MVLPSLAEAIGLNEAIMLQQIHYWVDRSNNYYNDQHWIYRTPETWKQNELKFFSISTINRTIKSLKKLGLIFEEKLGTKFGKNRFDRTNYHTLNYEELDKVELKITNGAFSQNDQMDKVNLTTSTSSNHTNAYSHNDQVRSSQNDQIRTAQIDQMITENKTETTTERTALFEIARSKLFDADEETRPKIPMSETWQPSEQFAASCKFRGINISILSTEDQDDLINEFRSYWMTQSTQLNQSGWEHKLLASLKHSQKKKQSPTGNPATFKGGKFSSAHGDMNW